MRRCVRCVLPEIFPNIVFDDAGVCNYCRQHDLRRTRLEEQRARMSERFGGLVDEIHGRHSYDCLLAWSGGKDSTYTLLILRQRYRLNVLALTLDNGFVSPTALQNMRRVSGELGVDHITFRPRLDLLRKVFGAASLDSGMYSERALSRASAVCNVCMSFAKGIALRTALERSIPMMAFGWSPGQVPLTSALFRRAPGMARATVEALMAPLRKIAGDALGAYFPQERQFENAGQIPYDVAPLAFLDYDEKQVVQSIAALGWRQPLDTDPNSTNCLLNAFANAVHKAQRGYHPYVMELSGLVRHGCLSRQEALERVEAPEIQANVELARVRLQL